MNILEEISGPEVAPVDLAEITAVDLPPLAIPASTVKNRAAVATMLSGDTEDIAGSYQGMVAEGGNTTVNQVMTKYHNESGALDQTALVKILGDSSLSIEQKKAAMEAHKQGRIASDSRVHLMTKGLEDASVDEDVEAEDARVSTASMLNEMQKSSEDRQALINAHAAGLSDQMGTVAVDALETFLAPFGTSITSVKIAKAKAEKEGRKFGMLDGIKAFVQAGGTKADMIKEMETLSPQAQVEWTRNMLDIISKNSSIIAPTDNQFNQMLQAQDYLGQGGYSSTAQFLDNASFLLDIFGFGALVKGNKAAKIANTAEDVVSHSLGRSAALNHGVDTVAPLPVKEAGKKAGPTHFDSQTSHVIDTEDRGSFTSVLYRTKDGGVLIRESDGQLIEYNAAFAAGKTDAEILKYTYEPLGFKGSKSTTAAPKATSSGFTPATVSAPMEGVNDGLIAAKQAEVADLLGEAGNLAEKGVPSRLRKEGEALAVPDFDIKARTKEIQKESKASYKDALKQATKESDDLAAEYAAKTDRMNNMLEINANAANASQRIDALEKEIAALQKANTPVPAKLNPISDFISRMEQNSVVRRENPASVANVLQQTNPSRARAAHAAMVQDESGMVADALYGVDRVQAIANDTLPQIITSTGAVTAKVVDIARDLRRLIKTSDVGIHLSPNELNAARAHVVNQFSKATDLYPIDSMGGFTTKLDGSTLEISSVYGTKEGAFTNATEAHEMALHQLRHEGVTADDVTLLKKQGLDYVPANLAEEAGKEGNYLIRIKMDRELTGADTLAADGGAMDKLTVKRNLADRLSSTVSQDSGSMSRWMFDAASMLDARITGGAIVGTDISSRFERAMLEVATKFTDKFNALPKDRQLELNKYIKEANFKGIAYDRTDITMNRGFSDAEADILQDWRKFWDMHFNLENFDMVRTYNAQGYMKLETVVGDDLAAKPLHKNNGIPVNVYDSTLGDVVRMTRQEFDDLYDSGGTIGKLRRPATFNGNTTEHVIVRNNAMEYLRRYRDSDKILNYREGYYQINYKAPRFVDEVTYKPNGEIGTRRAVAVGGTTSEVKSFADRMNRTANPGTKYITRANDRMTPRGSDDWFDVEAAAGRIAQKYRGQLLQDATGINHLGDGSHLASPVESAVRAAKSISGRTVMRPVIEAARTRFLEQYGSVLKSDGMGGHKFPSSPGDIGEKGMHDSKFVADARTTWEYINYLESGYINSLDVFIKQGLNTVATILGGRRFDKLERIALRMADADHGATGIAKGTVFTSYIALNPLRNWIVQTHQAVRTFAYNPVGWLSPNGVPRVIGEYFGSIAGAPNSARGVAFRRLMDESGLLDSVDKQNLVRGSLSDAAEASTGAFKWGRKAIELSRKVGFDAGETMNLVAHAAAVFDKRIRDGKGISSIQDMREMHSEIRAISYDMNFAGDMVYNQTSAAMVLQFLQVPHKAFLQATNRRLPPAIRRRMLAADLVMFGPPIALISAVFGGDILTDDKETNDWYIDGVVATFWNSLWSARTGEEQDVDYSGLSPYGLDGWAKMWKTLMEDGGVIPAFMNSPAGQVFFKDSGRIQSALAALGRYFTPWRDEERTKEETLTVMNEVLKISSGWNNGLKAKLMFESGKAMDRNGVLLDESVSNHEAFMQIFGFSTATVKHMYETQMATAQSTKAHADEVKEVFNSVKAYYQAQFESGVVDLKQMQAVTGEILSMYKDDPVALALITKSFESDIMGKEPQLLMQLLKSVELPTNHVTKDQIRQAPITEEQKAALIKRLDDAANARLEINKED